MLSKKKEEQLIKLSKNDWNAFEPLYDEFYSDVYTFINSRVGEAEISKDITSDVFIKALLNLRKYQISKISIKYWMLRIARNEVVNWAKSKERNLFVSYTEQQFSEVEEGLKNEMDDELAISEKNLLRSLNELSVKDIELIELRFFEKRAFHEIAMILDITENNAKVKTYRAIEKLRRLLT